jgi:Fe-S-cluster containining protein
MTLLEFAWLLNNMLEKWEKGEIIAFVAEEPAPEPRYEGNHVCRIQSEKSLCGLHEFRPMICRLEGLPILNNMGVRDYIICPYILDEQMKTDVKPVEIDEWVTETFKLSSEFYPVYEEPYWLSALNIECWFSVVLDRKISQPSVLKLRDIIRESFDLDFLTEHYNDITQLSRKLDLIDSFFLEAETIKNPRKAISILKDIQNKFPITGSYYYDEADQYLKLMRKITREQRKAN